MKRRRRTDDAAPEPHLETPSGAALAEVGSPAEDASDEEKREHAARYERAKARLRWGLEK